MSNIEVGEYIRTIDGYIRKIDNVNIDKNKITYYGKYILDIPYKNSQAVAEKKIKAHSKNIIDLIEVGDYVGNCEIQYIHKNEKGETLLENDNVTLTEKDIKTIVTKELFKEMEYRINE